MVRVGIFGTSVELNQYVSKMLVEEVLDQCCSQSDSEEIDTVVSHISGEGIGEIVFEEGYLRGAETVGLVLPSCRSEEWFPVDDIVYIQDKWGDIAVDELSEILDIAVWVGDLEPEEDWKVLSNSQDVDMVTISDTMMDWVSPASTLELNTVIDKMMKF